LGTFWSLDSRTQTLRCVDLWHPADQPLEAFTKLIREATFSRDLGVPGYVWAEAEPVWLADLAKDNRFPEGALAAEAGLVSACGFPIANRRGLQGVLVFYSRRIWPLSKNLLLLMVERVPRSANTWSAKRCRSSKKSSPSLSGAWLNSWAEGLIAMDRDGYCIYVNATAGRLLGHRPKTLLGKACMKSSILW